MIYSLVYCESVVLLFIYILMEALILVSSCSIFSSVDMQCLLKLLISWCCFSLWDEKMSVIVLLDMLYMLVFVQWLNCLVGQWQLMVECFSKCAILYNSWGIYWLQYVHYRSNTMFVELARASNCRTRKLNDSV